MLTLPKQPVTPAWHQQLAWRTYVTALFGVVSRRRDFTTEFRVGSLIAGVIPDQRRLLINPSLIPLPDARLRFDPVTEHGRRVRLLRAIAAHEAGHVVFSARKPADPADDRVGWLWNALEDERMERLVVRRFPDLAPDLTFLGDAMFLKDPKPTTDLLNACLVWRWAHDTDAGPFQVEADQALLWDRCVRPLVEAAWEAHRDDVEHIAREILALIPRTDDAGGRGDQPDDSLSADGGGMSAPQPEEGQPRRAKGPAEADQPNQDAKAGDAGAPPQVAENTQAAPGAGESATPTAPDPGAPSDTTPEGDAPLPSDLPDAPPAPQDPPGDQLPLTEGFARTLAGLLAPPETPARRTSHRSRGRFHYGRYAGGSERYFQQRTDPGRPAPFQLRLCVDLSSSMRGPGLQAATQATLTLVRAAHLARSRVTVIGFTHTPWTALPLDTPWPAAAALIQALRASGSTRLGPALHATLTLPTRHDERAVTIVITDGQLTDADARHCEGLLRPPGAPTRTPAPEIIPILIGDATAGTATFLRLFGHAHPVTDMPGMVQAVRSALTTLRARPH